MNKQELWQRLSDYQFDDLVPAHLPAIVVEKFGAEHGAIRAFADKLSRKLGWQRRFVMRALSEYKKFVFLGIISDFAVTPPRIIDQVWHEHLLFSAGYRAFCKDVIACNFDHSPELVPSDSQTDQFQAQYADTITLYKVEFGNDPPQDIWGAIEFAGKQGGRQAGRKEPGYAFDGSSFAFGVCATGNRGAGNSSVISECGSCGGGCGAGCGAGAPCDSGTKDGSD